MRRYLAITLVLLGVFVFVPQAEAQGLVLSQYSVNVNMGQSQTITVTTPAGQIPNLISLTNGTVAYATVNSYQITIYGLNNGSTQMTFCTYDNSCASVSVTVGGGNTNTYGQITFSQNNPILTVGQSTTVNIFSNISNPSYYIQNNTNSGIVSASLNGSTLFITALNTGSTNVVICSNNISRCESVFVMVRTSGSIAGALVYNNGTLINDYGTIYITYKNSKSGFTSAQAFTSLGYKWANIISGSTGNIPHSGYNISSASVAHPWGSWINNAGTIYFVHDSGLIPIPSMGIFTSNGGVLKSVVDANSYDFNRPVLAQMDNNDWRLK